MKIVISSGHGANVAGAGGFIQEVPEARRVVNHVAPLMRELGDSVIVFHDDKSKTKSDNLAAIVNFHNAQDRDLDVSVHFNAYKTTDKPVGTETLYKTQGELATRVSKAIANAGGFINRNAKPRNDLAFLNSTTKPAILIEVCFVDSRTDVQLYQEHFDAICRAIAESITGKSTFTLPQGKQ